MEISAISARNKSKNTVYYPLIRNIHKNGILRQSFVPYLDKEIWTNTKHVMHEALEELEGNLLMQARSISNKILNNLNYIGILAVEFFVV